MCHMPIINLFKDSSAVLSARLHFFFGRFSHSPVSLHSLHSHHLWNILLLSLILNPLFPVLFLFFAFIAVFPDTSSSTAEVGCTGSNFSNPLMSERVFMLVMYLIDSLGVTFKVKKHFFFLQNFESCPIVL